MQKTHDAYLMTDDPGRLDFARIHAWLTNSYWATGISREKVEQAAKHSALVIGAYLNDQQVGYCRVVSDRTRFAWLADVIVDPDHRGRGLGRAIVRFALEYPELKDVHNWLLGTRDAHGVYADLGFAELEKPQSFMQLKRAQVL